MWKLGSKMKDKITNFTGVVTTCSQHFTGSNTYVLTPYTDSNGNIRNNASFDEDRLELVVETQSIGFTETTPQIAE